ncbi:MAG: MFS transporter [Coleofasciculaceae cyanobacterium RL_1_1]|nr:MFS transporter [Coleofasciculaceae cyanobacterium RL_1_1]
MFTAALFFWINMSAQTPVFPLYIQSIGANQSEVGVIMGAFAIGLVISRPRLGQMADHHSRIRVLRIGIIVAIIAPLLYITSIELPQLFAIRVFTALASPRLPPAIFPSSPILPPLINEVKCLATCPSRLPSVWAWGLLWVK